jgi:hypothetical protein
MNQFARQGKGRGGCENRLSGGRERKKKQVADQGVKIFFFEFDDGRLEQKNIQNQTQKQRMSRVRMLRKYILRVEWYLVRCVDRTLGPINCEKSRNNYWCGDRMDNLCNKTNLTGERREFSIRFKETGDEQRYKMRDAKSPSM